MIALVLFWCLIVGVSLAIALVVGWFTSPRTVGILYIVAAIAFGGAVFDNILNGTTLRSYPWVRNSLESFQSINISLIKGHT